MANKQEQNDNIVAEFDPHNHEDHLEQQAAWDFFTERVSRLLKDIAEQYKHDDIFHVSGSSIGWRNQSADRLLQVDNGEELIMKITPNSGGARVEVKQYTDKKLDINVYHHDSPTGELYIVHPVYATTARVFENSGEKAAKKSAGIA